MNQSQLQEEGEFYNVTVMDSFIVEAISPEEARKIIEDMIESWEIPISDFEITVEVEK